MHLTKLKLQSQAHTAMSSLQRTVYEYYLPLIKLFTVDNNYLPLITLFTVNKIFSRQ